jgi:two-component system LytT family response regulator
MRTLRTLIVDDEELARRGLEIRLQRFPNITIVGQCRNGRDALAALKQSETDLMFLDIQMPGMDGFEVLRRMSGRNMPTVVFVTAFDKYAIRAFEANALDYLLKPINDERLAETICRAADACEEREAQYHRSKLLKLVCELTGQDLTLDKALAEAEREEPRYPQRLAIQDGRQTNCVDVDSIDWIDAAGDYMCIHAGGDTFVLRGTMKRLEEVLDPRMFVRIHRSAIVNRHRVSSLRPHRNGEYFLRLDCDHELKLSRTYKSALSRLADNL